jgi:hypothetical protein
MKTLGTLIAALIALSVAACAQQLPTGAMEYSTAFERNIPAGQTLPGTDIKYIGKTDQGAQMSIGGQTAIKRMLDSLTWHGDVAPGINVDYGLRVITFDSQSLEAGGTAKVIITSVKPQAASPSSLPQDALTFRGVVSYNVPKGKTIPGTTISYLGKTPDGAQLGGIEGYAFRQEADSILWTGQLADKVFLGLDLRVVLFTDTSLRTTGTATLYIAP